MRYQWPLESLLLWSYRSLPAVRLAINHFYASGPPFCLPYASALLLCILEQADRSVGSRIQSRANGKVCGSLWVLLLMLIPWDLHEEIIILGSQMSSDCGNNAFQSVAVGFIAGPGLSKIDKDIE